MKRRAASDKDRNARFASATCSYVFNDSVSCDSAKWPPELQTSQKRCQTFSEVEPGDKLRIDLDTNPEAEWNDLEGAGSGLQQRRSPLAQILPGSGHTDLRIHSAMIASQSR